MGHLADLVGINLELGCCISDSWDLFKQQPQCWQARATGRANTLFRIVDRHWLHPPVAPYGYPHF